MADDLKQRIIENLNQKSTDELLDIWVNGTEEEWQPFVFDTVKEILLKRQITVTEDDTPEDIPADLPDRESKLQADKHIELAKIYLGQKNPLQAVAECDSAIKLLPENDQAYYLRGMAYDQLQERVKAMADLQTVGKFNPDVDEYWDKIKDLQKRLDDDFSCSPCKRNLDQALIYIEDEQPDLAMGQIDVALQCIPESASAYTWLGWVYQSMGKDEQAIEAYEHAISLNPRYYDARKKLAEAKAKFEEEQSRQPVGELPEDYYKELEEKIVKEETEGITPTDKDDVAPEWIYKSDPLYEVKDAIDLGVSSLPKINNPFDKESEPYRRFPNLIRALLTGSFRSHNPVYLIGIFILGCVFCLPLGITAVPMIMGEAPAGEIEGAYFILALPGLIMFWNVMMSLFTPDDGSMDDDGRKFY